MLNNKLLKITFLGTGTSMGIPIVGCSCDVCLSDDPKDKKLRSSVLLEIDGKNIIIDIGPDFRQQILKKPISKLDGILITHHHRDHIAGLDDLRPLNFFMKDYIDIYCNDETNNEILRVFEYIFKGTKNDVPKLNINVIENNDFYIDNILITPIKANHLYIDVIGYKILDFVYLTDVKTISDKEIEKIKNCKILVINALRKKEHISHLSLDEALEVIKKVNPKQAYLTHISHQMGKYTDVSKELPPNTYLAYDGLELFL